MLAKKKHTSYQSLDNSASKEYMLVLALLVSDKIKRQKEKTTLQSGLKKTVH